MCSKASALDPRHREIAFREPCGLGFSSSYCEFFIGVGGYLRMIYCSP